MLKKFSQWLVRNSHCSKTPITSGTRYAYQITKNKLTLSGVISNLLTCESGYFSILWHIPLGASQNRIRWSKPAVAKMTLIFVNSLIQRKMIGVLWAASRWLLLQKSISCAFCGASQKLRLIAISKLVLILGIHFGACIERGIFPIYYSNLWIVWTHHFYAE